MEKQSLKTNIQKKKKWFTAQLLTTHQPTPRQSPGNSSSPANSPQFYCSEQHIPYSMESPLTTLGQLSWFCPFPASVPGERNRKGLMGEVNDEGA